MASKQVNISEMNIGYIETFEQKNPMNLIRKLKLNTKDY